VNVEIRTRGATMLSVESLKHFQGNLKSLSESNYLKLKKEILELGFSEPLSVWKQGENHFLLNGHQRVRTIRRMVEDGYNCPALPVNWVDAVDENEAKRKVLALTSQYGKMETQGLYEFISDSDISIDDIEESFHFPEIKIEDFRAEYYDPKPEEPDLEPPENKEFLVVCELRNEEEQARVFEQLVEQGVKCKLM